MLSKQQIKSIVSLQQKKYRKTEKLFLVEGENAVADLLFSDWEIRMICSTESISQELKSLIGVKFKGEHLIVSVDDMHRISPQTAPQGVLAVVRQHENRFDITELEDQLVLVLDDIQDPGNMGTILRIADWFGIHHVICSNETVECFNPKVVQASMGSLFRIAVHYMELVELFRLNEGSLKLPVYGTMMQGDNIFATELKKNAFLVFGNESIGIGEDSISFLTHSISIPSFNNSSGKGPDSLNVAIAAGIVCAEFRRRFIS